MNDTDWAAVDTSTGEVTDTPDAAPPDPDPGPGPFFPDCQAWLTQWLLPTWVRAKSQNSIWCPQWWMHPEAMSRVEAMWRAWEQLRLDAGTRISSWWRDHGDYHLAVLVSPHGPFKGCTVEKGHRPRAVPSLPVDPAPAGLLDDALGVVD